jgi:multidrug efflux pump subunit AcrB
MRSTMRSAASMRFMLKDLPEDVDPPTLNKFSLDDLPVMTMSASSKLDEAAFYDLMDKRVAPVLSRVQGVAKVNLIGGQEREIQVSIDAKAWKVTAFRCCRCRTPSFLPTSTFLPVA